MVNKKNKIYIIGTVGLPNIYGGWETLADNLVSTLEKDYSFVVYCSAPMYEQQPTSYKQAELRYSKFKANGPQSLIYDTLTMLDATRDKNATLLILGVSGTFLLPVLRIKRFITKSNNIFITNIDGIEWAREKWGRLAKMILKINEWFAVNNSDFVISDNQGIHEYVTQKYNVNSNVIPYGGDQINKFLPKSFINKTLQNYGINSKFCLTVARIEPENNIEIFVNAAAISSNIQFVIIGNYKNSEYGKKLYKSCEGIKNIKMLGGIYDRNELDAIRISSMGYFHGHSAGGTNPALVEAMHLSLNIICFDVNFNRFTTNELGKYITTSESLALIFNELFADEIPPWGMKLELFAKENYTWKSVANKYAKIFNYD